MTPWEPVFGWWVSQWNDEIQRKVTRLTSRRRTLLSEEHKGYVSMLLHGGIARYSCCVEDGDGANFQRYRDRDVRETTLAFTVTTFLSVVPFLPYVEVAWTTRTGEFSVNRLSWVKDRYRYPFLIARTLGLWTQDLENFQSWQRASITMKLRIEKIPYTVRDTILSDAKINKENPVSRSNIFSTGIAALRSNEVRK